MKNKAPSIFILDVDGVLTNGQFLYTEKGKVMKIFGPDDNDGLSLLRNFIEIRFITGDKKGYPISYKRVTEDMGYRLDLVSTIKRIDWIEDRYNLDEVIYMGDGIFDHYVMRKVLYAISTRNGDKNSRKAANFITERNGGERAVAEACLHLLDKFFMPYNPFYLPNEGENKFGEPNDLNP